MSKTFIRTFIIIIEIISLLGCLVMIPYSLINEKWEVAAASLAVIAALISNFNAQRISWKQEDEYLPDIFIDFDLQSHKGVVLLVVQNSGGSRAYDINMMVDPPITIFDEDPIVSKQISFLDKNQLLQFYVYPSVDMFYQNEFSRRPTQYNLRYSFRKTPNSKPNIKEKIISIEPFRKTTLYESESEKFFYQNSKISQKLQNIENAILKLKNKSDS